MHVKISKIGLITTNKTLLTISAFCLEQNIKLDDINLQRKATLFLGETKLSCTVSTAAKNKGGSCALSLKVADSLANYNLIWPYHHKSNLNFTLLVHDNVNPSLVEEANRLLDTLSTQTGRKRGDILCELTAFKNVPGKRDLNLVSAKQLPIVIDKMKDIMKPHEKEIT